jgi:hypothetical protein
VRPWLCVLQVVTCNTVALAMDHHGIDDGMSAALTQANLVFTALFGVEMLVKFGGREDGSRECDTCGTLGCLCGLSFDLDVS